MTIDAQRHLPSTIPHSTRRKARCDGMDRTKRKPRVAGNHPTKMYLKGMGVMSPVPFMLHLRSNVKDWSTP